MIGAGINPGVYRRRFAFEAWPDFDADLFDEIYNDDSGERTLEHKIYGGDISPKAFAIAQQNIKSAGVAKYIDLQLKPLSQWNEAPEPAGVLVTNPPYGERISSEDMDGLYAMIGTKLKHVFQGYHAWIIGYREEYFRKIGLSPSVKLPLYNGALECELREYVIFDGDYKSFRQSGGKIHHGDEQPRESRGVRGGRRESDARWREDARKAGFGGKKGRPSTDRNAPRRQGWKRDGGESERDFRQGAEHGESENPLALRRNEHALKGIVGKIPTLPRSEQPMIRPRRGWKKGPQAEE